MKRVLLRTMPGAAGALQILWQRRHVRRLEKRLGLPRIHQAIVARHGQRVLQGPFAGMAYVSCAVGSAFIPKLVGSYEAELHDVIAQIIAVDYPTIIDVGCAEGYYAVGLARRMPSTRVYAFDIDGLARNLCQTMARANGVTDRVIIGGKCDAEGLESMLGGCDLIICDCEGYELDLLRPDIAPGLRSTDVLVELHDRARPGLTPAILERFQDSHDIRLIDTLERRSANYPDIQFLSPEDQALAVCELRHGSQQWAFMTSKNRSIGKHEKHG